MLLKKIVITLLLLSFIMTGCTVKEIKEIIEEKHIVNGDNHNFITFSDNVFKKDGEYTYTSCHIWNNKTECNDKKCISCGYVHKICVKNGTDDLNTHTSEEWDLFDDCCDSICRKLNYSEPNIIANEFDNVCFCMVPNSPLRIKAYFDVNAYRNYTESCNLYVKEQYGEYWINQEWT